MMMMMMMSLSLSLSLEEMGREHDGSNDGVVLAGEVVHLLLLGVGIAPQQLVVFDHLALVADCLHVVLVVVARLKEGTLQQLTVSALSVSVPITNKLAFHWKTKTEVVREPRITTTNESFLSKAPLRRPLIKQSPLSLNLANL